MASVQELLNKVKTVGVDQSVAKTGGNFELPPEGTARLRLVGYFEIGKHKKEFKGTVKYVDKVQLVFELSGKGYEPHNVDGELVPIRKTLTLSLSQSDKSRFFQLFSRMRNQDTKHMIELLLPEHAFLCEIKHSEDGKYANLVEESMRRAAVDSVQEDGSIVKVPIKVADALTPMKYFLWDSATPEEWDALFIPGEYPERKDENGKVVAPAASKNLIQNKIKEAQNFAKSPIYSYAVGAVTKDGTKALDQAIKDATPSSSTDAEDTLSDPLEGVN